MVALIDCNNFFASCERVFRPELRGRPVVVLSNNDGCVIARSDESKALGIPMGAPAFKYREVLEANQVKVFSSNFALYGDMSSRVMNILNRYSPDVEVYSIDEAFLGFDGFEGHYDLQEYCEGIRRTVLKSTGIPISIGVAKTKSQAKLANRIAKKFPERTKGVYLMDNETKVEKALKWVDVGDVWGIGRRHAKRLQSMGVRKAFDFTQLPEQWVRKHMSVVGLRLQRDLKGERNIEIEHARDKKSIATTRSFETMYTEYDDLRERVSTFAVSCAEKLRKQGSNCNALMVFVHTNGFRKDLDQYKRNIVVTSPYPTSSDMEMVQMALKGLRKIYKKGFSYKKAGVVALSISPDKERQLALFNESDARHKPLMKAVDYLNRNLGTGKVKLAVQDLDRRWKMNQSHLSKRYTTKLDDIIKVNV